MHEVQEGVKRSVCCLVGTQLLGKFANLAVAILPELFSASYDMLQRNYIVGW